MKATVHFILRLDKPTDSGATMIYILITLHNRNKMKFSLARTIPLRKRYEHLTPAEILAYPMEKTSPNEMTRDELYYWDPVKERATRGCGSMESLNTFLNEQLVKANDIINDLVKRGKAINRENFKREFFRTCTKMPFFEYCNHQLNVVLKNTLSQETRKSYTTIIQKLNRFKPGIRMEEIDFKFLTAYVNWMKAPITEKGCDNDDRTVANNLKVVRTMIRLAMKNGDFPEEYYPFSNFQIASTITVAK